MDKTTILWFATIFFSHFVGFAVGYRVAPRQSDEVQKYEIDKKYEYELKRYAMWRDEQDDL